MKTENSNDLTLLNHPPLHTPLHTTDRPGGQDPPRLGAGGHLQTCDNFRVGGRSGSLAPTAWLLPRNTATHPPTNLQWWTKTCHHQPSAPTAIKAKLMAATWSHFITRHSWETE